MSRAVGLARSRNFANCSAGSIPLRRGFQSSCYVLNGEEYRSIPPRPVYVAHGRSRRAVD